MRIERSLFIGGTKGLGRALAIEASARGVREIVIAGRSAWRSETLREFNPEALRSKILRAVQLDLLRTETFSPLMQDLAKHGWRDEAAVFWVAGEGLKKPFAKTGDRDIYRLAELHFCGPASLVRRLMTSLPKMHLVVIASTSSSQPRADEAVYSAMKAAKAHFARCLSKELAERGGRTTLVHPGGMKTEDFWDGTGVDTSNFMDPADVARLIWDEVVAQAEPYAEFSIPRPPDGRNPVVVRGVPAIKAP